jgi:hypothetical protein
MSHLHTIVVACLILGGCTKRWTAEVHQPPLLLMATKEARTSMPRAITYRDVEMGRFQITNTAYYTVVSRDRLRFHVTLHHKWNELADMNNWTAYVEDANGKRHYPEDVSVRVRLLSQWRFRGVTYQMNMPLYRGHRGPVRVPPRPVRRRQAGDARAVEQRLRVSLPLDLRRSRRGLSHSAALVPSAAMP